MADDDFFEEQEEQSRVKTEILVKYFAAWSKVMLAQPRVATIRYQDLYCGPGRYRSGDLSTPLLVLAKTISDHQLRSGCALRFNDANGEYIRNLRADVASWPGAGTLRNQPIISQQVVDEGLVRNLESDDQVPTLSFVDPWGYSGLSRKLIQILIRDWGSELVFFFNYNRINPAIENSIVERHMAALFSDQILRTLRQILPGMTPWQREAAVLRAIGDSVTELGAQFIIPFRFLRPSGRPSHYIIFVTKHRRGYAIMKDIMATAGIVDEDGVPRFEYMPAGSEMQLKFNLDRPIQLLADDLVARFSGQTLTAGEVFDRHHVGTPFVSRNYKRVLAELEAQGRITAEPDASRRRKGTFADRVTVTFP